MLSRKTTRASGSIGPIVVGVVAIVVVVVVVFVIVVVAVIVTFLRSRKKSQFYHDLLSQTASVGVAVDQK